MTTLKHVVVGGVPYDLGALEPGAVTAEMLNEDVVDGTSIVLNELNQISLGEAGELVVNAEMLTADVWEQVRVIADEVMDEGFGEVLNGEY